MEGGSITFTGADVLTLFGKNATDGDYEYNYDYNDTGGDACCLGEVCTPDSSRRFEAAFVPALYSVVLVLGLLGNGLVLAVLGQLRREWSVTDTFVLHLAVADTLLLLTLPFWAAQAATEWSFGTPMCKVTGALFQINFYCGIFLLACISLDRYLSVVHAVQMLSRRKPWQVQASCLCVWALCLLLSVPDWVFLRAAADSRRGNRVECRHDYTLHAGDRTKDWRLASRLVYHTAGFLLPSAVMVVCYSRILLRLRRGGRDQRKQRAVRVILVLVAAFFLSWTPYNAALAADTLHEREAIEDTCHARSALDVALLVTSTLGYVHCCLNPVLYAFVGVNFRRRLARTLKALGCRLEGGRGREDSRRSSAWSQSGNTSTSGF